MFQRYRVHHRPLSVYNNLLIAEVEQRPAPYNTSVIELKERYRSPAMKFNGLDAVVAAHGPRPDILCFFRDLGKVTASIPLPFSLPSACVDMCLV